MKARQEEFYFCGLEEDSIATLRFLGRIEKEDGLEDYEGLQLSYMEKRRKEGQIWLMPAVVFAVANQDNCKNFFLREEKSQQDIWKKEGVNWLRHYPAFLNRVGWRERIFAVWAAGLLTLAESGEKKACSTLRRLLSDSWTFLWSRVKQTEVLGGECWQELLSPWEDSDAMGSAMAGVLLLMVALQKRSVCDRYRFTNRLRRLRQFSQQCVKEPDMFLQRAALRESCFVWRPENMEPGKEVGTQNSEKEALLQERMAWLLTHFRNPQRPTWLKEKGRISSEWLDTLFAVMERAGLSRSACETMKISGEEICGLLECFHEKMTERQYMTFLLLYAVTKELVAAGSAAALERQREWDRVGERPV